MSGKYEYTELYKTDKILFYKEKILLFILVHAIMNKEKILLFILVHAIMNKKRSKFIYAVGLYYRIGGSL
ncbi:hypothetical protein CI600_13975 [Vibrio parahaemolyticus]|nr:hypothetical protein CI600_13975 [Vibrio parahaemolyticus]